MLRYLAKRLIYAILVLLAVSVLTFFISTMAPGDLIQSHRTLEGSQIAYQQQSYSQRTSAYTLAAERLGLHLPLFYFAVHPACFPDSLYHIIRKEERVALKQLLYRHGSWPEISRYRNSILALLHDPHDVRNHAQLSNDAEFLLLTSDTGRIKYLLESIAKTIPTDSLSLQLKVKSVRDAYTSVGTHKTEIHDLLPTIQWNGPNNQYHRWISMTLRGDLGTSLIDGRPVKTKIKEAIRWTLNVNVIAILLAFAISIPLGVTMARNTGHRLDRFVSAILFAFYAIPSFWLAMLCIVFFTTSEYGQWLDVFPTGGVGNVTAEMSLFEKVSIRINYLVLPVFCVTVGSLAYLTRQMRGSMLRELKQDYVRMARAKGVNENNIHWKHAFRNALFPMITMVGSAFPAAISGAVILEVIFSIPGMGRLMYMSILASDWPVVFAMVLLAACLTVIGYLVTDLLYRLADPRVELQTHRR